MHVGQEQQPTRRAAYRLDGVRASIGEARRHAEDFLRGCVPPLPPITAQNALVVVSELVTNAVRHAPGPCTLELSESGAELVIAVSDTSTVPPHPRTPDMAVGGGFGWHLVARFADRVEVWPDGLHGKTVRAVLARDGVTLGP
jgi:anti-sigma regulatory factor (Ser/Thr protein kinase)